MSHIFVSYASEDRDRIMPLVRALEATGWSVFWDRTIPVGETWQKIIGAEIEACRCMVVIWSTTSINKEWVYEEASEGKRRGVLAPVLIDDIIPPIGFRSIQAAKLGGWDGKAASAEFDRMIRDISHMLDTPVLKKEEEKQQADLEAARGDEMEATKAREQVASAEKARLELEGHVLRTDLGTRVPPSVSATVILDRHYAYSLTSYATDVMQRGASELTQTYDELFDVLTCSILLFDEIYIEQHHVSSLELRLDDKESEAYFRLFTPFSLSELVGTSSENLAIEFQIRQDLGNSELAPLIASYYGRKSVRPENIKELVVYVNKILQRASVLGSSIFLSPKRTPLFEYKLGRQQPTFGNHQSQPVHFLMQVPGRRYRSLDQLESLRSDPARKLLRERTWEEVKRRAEDRMTDAGESLTRRQPELIGVPGEIPFRADFYRKVRIRPSNLQGKTCFFFVPERE